MTKKEVKAKLKELPRWRVKCYCDADCTWRTLKHKDGGWIKWEDIKNIIEEV